MTSFPKWLVPMAATLTQERFTGPEWIFERKFDGIRLLVQERRQRRALLAQSTPQDIPSVVEAVKKLPVRDAILDGEITWGRGNVGYHIFDVMWLDGRKRDVAAARRTACVVGPPAVPAAASSRKFD